MRPTRQLYFVDRDFTEAQVKWMMRFGKGAPNLIYSAKNPQEQAKVLQHFKTVEKHLKKLYPDGSPGEGKEQKLFKQKVKKMREGLEKPWKEPKPWPKKGVGQ